MFHQGLLQGLVYMRSKRTTIYFSPRKDLDILENIKSIESGDLSWYVKNLMRDGLRYRDSNCNIETTKSQQQIYTPVSDLPPKADMTDIMSIKTNKKEVSDEDIESSFDHL